MPAAILIITIGVTLAYSAFKGIGVTDVLAGALGDTLDPHGPATPDITAPTAVSAPDTTTDPGSSVDTSRYHFKGPNASLLASLATAAVSNFNLTITSTSGGTHVPTSYHYKARAFDAAGKPADMAAYYQWAHDTYGHTLAELFYDPKGGLKNGAEIGAIGGHSDHVHTAA